MGSEHRVLRIIVTSSHFGGTARGVSVHENGQTSLRNGGVTEGDVSYRWQHGGTAHACAVAFLFLTQPTLCAVSFQHWAYMKQTQYMKN